MSDDPEDKTHHIFLNDQIVPISSLRLTHKRGGEAVAHRETGSIPQASDAAILGDGTVQSDLRGTPAKGEGQTLEVCRAFVLTLQHRGYRWHLPVSAPSQDDDADCVSASLDRGGGTLRIQHVRAITEETTWRTLARAKKVSQVIASVLDAAGTLRAAIDKKAQRSAPPQRANLTLALDATTASAYSLGGVVRAFRDNHGEWCQALGFAAVWLLGPSSDLTYRLDERDPADAA